jgi:hypothetical protein
MPSPSPNQRLGSEIPAPINEIPAPINEIPAPINEPNPEERGSSDEARR